MSSSNRRWIAIHLQLQLNHTRNQVGACVATKGPSAVNKLAVDQPGILLDLQQEPGWCKCSNYYLMYTGVESVILSAWDYTSYFGRSTSHHGSPEGRAEPPAST